MLKDPSRRIRTRRLSPGAGRGRGNRILLHFIAFAVFLAAMDFHHPAHAYLDPGTGTMILQLLLGGVAGFLFVLKLYWDRFASLFRGNRKKPGTDVDAETDADTDTAPARSQE